MNTGGGKESVTVITDVSSAGQCTKVFIESCVIRVLFFAFLCIAH